MIFVLGVGYWRENFVVCSHVSLYFTEVILPFLEGLFKFPFIDWWDFLKKYAELYWSFENE